MNRIALTIGLLMLAGCASTIPLPTCNNPIYHHPDLSTVSRDEVPCLQRYQDTWYGKPLTARILIYREETGTLNYFIIDKRWE